MRARAVVFSALPGSNSLELRWNHRGTCGRVVPASTFSSNLVPTTLELLILSLLITYTHSTPSRGVSGAVPNLPARSRNTRQKSGGVAKPIFFPSLEATGGASLLGPRNLQRRRRHLRCQRARQPAPLARDHRTPRANLGQESLGTSSNAHCGGRASADVRLLTSRGDLPLTAKWNRQASS